MTKSKNEVTKTKSIETAIAKWDKEQTVADFVREELMEIDPRTNKPMRGTVTKKLVYLTENAIEDSDKIKAAELLLKMAAGNESKSPAVQVNQQFNLGSWAESLE